MKRNISAIPSLIFGSILIFFASANIFAASITDLTNSCADCHGKDGASSHPEIPIIGGLSAQYISDSFAAYKDKIRPCTEVKEIAGPHKGEKGDMCKVSEKLSKAEIKQVADYFAAKPFVRAKQSFDAGLAEKGKGIHALECVKCHDKGGSSADDDAGILAGQWMPYLEKEFEAYTTGKREMPKKMKPKMDKLSKEDIKALINYYGSFQ